MEWKILDSAGICGKINTYIDSDMNPASAISRLALFQCLVVITGVLTTCGMLKLNQYGDGGDFRWNPAAVAVRNAGFLLLVLPVLWTLGSIYLERHAPHRWGRGWTITSGVLLAFAMLGFLSWTTVTPYFFQKRPLQTVSWAP